MDKSSAPSGTSDKIGLQTINKIVFLQKTFGFFLLHNSQTIVFKPSIKIR